MRGDVVAYASFHPVISGTSERVAKGFSDGSGATITFMDTASATPKDRLRRVIDEQPDDSSFDEILKELAFAAMVERGLADSLAGRTTSHEEVGKILESWRK
jgi:predicted transcriptional regulator